jgi:large subunit ribosomal protein L29
VRKLAILKRKELRSLGSEELKDKLKQLKSELSTEKGSVASGTKPDNPGKIKEIKRTIARILTVLHEREGGKKQK